MAQAGLKTVLREAEATVGGGLRSSELTLPGFIHDVCSAVHPLALTSPFFRALPLADFGLEWIQPSAPLAHPLDDGSAALLEQSLDATAEGLGEGGGTGGGCTRRSSGSGTSSQTISWRHRSGSPAIHS